MELLERIAICKQEEEICQFTSFNNQDAWEIGHILAERAKNENLPIAIDISLNGRTLFCYCAPGSNGYNDHWIARKQNTVQLQQMSTLRYGLQLQENGKIATITDFLNPVEYALVGGGFPIIIKNTGVVGCIAISGLVDTEDHRVVVESIMQYLGK